MNTFSIKEVIKNNWEIVKANLWFVVGTTLVYCIFNSSFNLKSEEEEWVFSGIAFITAAGLGVILWVIGMIVQMGYLKIYLKLQSGVHSEFKELFTHYQPFWRYLGSMILYCLRVFVGLLLLIVPGIIWAIKFQFMPALVIDKGMKPLEAMRESGRMTEGHKMHLFKFGLVALAINLLGLICLGVGLLVTIPLTTLAYIQIYRKLSVLTP